MTPGGCGGGHRGAVVEGTVVAGGDHSLCRRLNGFQVLSLNDMTILFLVISLFKTVSVE